MSQSDFGSMDPETESGTELAADLNAWRTALHSCHKGSSRPSYVQTGMLWINDNSSPWAVNFYDGTSDIIVGYIDSTNHNYIPTFGGGTDSMSRAATTDIGSKLPAYVSLTGTTTISSFGSSAPVGAIKTVNFAADGGSLTNSSSLVLPSAADISISAGDTAIAIHIGGGNWRVLSYIKANGKAVIGETNAPASIPFMIDGGGLAISTGVKGDIMIPFACAINKCTMLADTSGSIVVDIWKQNYTSFPPSAGNTIVASAKPTLSSAQKSQDTTLTGWTKNLSAGDILRYNVDSASTITRVMINLDVNKS